MSHHSAADAPWKVRTQFHEATRLYITFSLTVAALLPIGIVLRDFGG